MVVDPPAGATMGVRQRSGKPSLDDVNLTQDRRAWEPPMVKPHPAADPDGAYVFRVRAEPRSFAEQIHARVARIVEDAIEQGLDTRGEQRGAAEVGPLRRAGRPS